MPIFHRKKIIKVNLGKLTMSAVMKFPKKKAANLEAFYLKNTFGPNHLQIGVIKSRVYTSGIHDFEYDAEKEEIRIFSRFQNAAFLIYGALIIPITPLIAAWNTNTSELTLIGITILLFIFLSLILILGIRAESKKIERELVIRLNLLKKK